MTTALFLLRCKQTGLLLDELDSLSTGMIFDMFTESVNDSATYDTLASQEDMDAF